MHFKMADCFCELNCVEIYMEIAVVEHKFHLYSNHAYVMCVSMCTQSVTEDNFRCSGARLLSFLCGHLPEDLGHKFRTQLLNMYDNITSYVRWRVIVYVNNID